MSIKNFFKNIFGDNQNRLDDIESFNKKLNDELIIIKNELKLLTNKVNAIKIPEVKNYDSDIKLLNEKINNIKIKNYDFDIKSLNEKVDSIKIPTVKDYDSDIKLLNEKIDAIKIPEVKNYDSDIKSLNEKITKLENGNKNELNNMIADSIIMNSSMDEISKQVKEKLKG